MNRTLALRASAALSTLAFALAACGGGGGGGGSLPTTTGPGATSFQKLGVTLSGIAPATRNVNARTTTASGSTTVTVSYNGVTVGTGTLDSNGFAEVDFTQAVPAGATVTVAIGTNPPITATVALASGVAATAVSIVYSAGTTPTITVTSAADAAGDGHVDASDPEQQTSTEDPGNGEDHSISSTGGTLPSDLPITISVCGTTTITVAPASGAPNGMGLHFEEKVHDSDANAKFEYATNAFTAPLNFPYLSSAARIHIQVEVNGNDALEIEAPIGSITGSGGASPSPSPSASTCPSPMPVASTSPEPSESPEPSASPIASPSATPTASASPVATATP